MLARLFVFFFLLAKGNAYVVSNGILFDDATVASLITVITVTNPIRSHPSTTYIKAVQGSLFRTPALRLCRKIIVFDGVRDRSSPEIHEAYQLYKEKVIDLTQTDVHFTNTDLIFCPKWVHLVGAIKIALKEVKTPFVLIQQHDLLLKKGFDLNGLIATMMVNPLVKYVHLAEGPNSELWLIDGVVEGETFVPLCRSFGWTDRTHVARKDYYENFILPLCPEMDFMETTINTMLAQGYERIGFAIHSDFGSYLYGGMGDGKYILHLDARQN